MRTLVFWQLVVVFSLFVATNIAFLFHGIAFVSGSGFSASQAGFASAFSGVSGLISKVAWGWALGRANARFLSIAAFGCAGGGTALLLLATTMQSMPVLVLCFTLWGIGFGGVTPLSEYMWAASFGRRYLGAVRSAAVPVQVMTTALAPLLVAIAFDAAGSYRGAFTGIVGVYAMGALMVTGMRSTRAERAPATVSDHDVGGSSARGQDDASRPTS